MDIIEGIIMMFDEVLDTGRKRHIAGGILLSLSVTVMTIKDKEKEYDNE